MILGSSRFPSTTCWIQRVQEPGSGPQPSVAGQGYTNTPGLHSAEQVEAWKPVTEAVHKEGGVIFAQLMHTGRIGHPVLLPDGLVPIGPSAVKAEGKVFTHEGMLDFVEPKEMTEAEIQEAIADFANAARNAIAAGFDGVEIHGANGYLVHQFLSVNANRRTDQWGGSAENRARFALEVAKATVAAIGADKVGIRLSPGAKFNDITDDPDMAATYVPLVEELAGLDLAYLHLMEQADRELTTKLRAAWAGVFILNPDTGFGVPTGPDAIDLVKDGTADMISYGALFLANPDLPERLKARGPFNEPDRTTFYGGTEQGYTDYPALG
ncbi:alkene reductase [Arsenicicoccus piscis]|uniref:Alkene reductase n=1 Tax=Arsenicicoccus piscis TaxID=673954 RepID=A0ABQ6HND3_9MICO|nr:alkene reductase [Arsenicicoccus piscis]GMA19214.1 alkene reductase [Arsenicicoccus piscis]